jgi:hypothetical protein
MDYVKLTSKEKKEFDTVKKSIVIIEPTMATRIINRYSVSPIANPG